MIVNRLIDNRASRELAARSEMLVGKIEVGLPRLMLLWVIAVSFGSGLRVAFATTPSGPALDKLATALPYVLIVLAPVATILFALRQFPANAFQSQPRIRLARFGHWQPINPIGARTLPLFGAGGFMASLLIGILINIPVRTMEFLTAMPPVGGAAPLWARTLHAMMLVDLVLLSSLYAFAFVMALRHAPLFPRFLALVWGVDILMQIGIARVMGNLAFLPREVSNALADMLEGNLKKVLISIAIWLPYLLLSKRVNLTYRARVRA
jgi:Protein of unknown function (DUF2569)